MTKRLRRFWTSRSERQRAWLRWFLPLAGLVALVLLDWLRFTLTGVATRDEARRLFLWIGLALVGATVAKVCLTRRWTVQDLASVALWAGLAGLCLRLLGRYGPQPPPEWSRDLIQANLDVGAILLLVGLALLAFARLTGRGRDDG